MLNLTDQQPPPDNIQVLLTANGTAQISWTRPSAVCAANNVSYDINITPTDGNPLDEGIQLPITTKETNIVFNLTAGREYCAHLIARNTDCSISSCAIQKVFTAVQNPNPGKHTGSAVVNSLTSIPLVTYSCSLVRISRPTVY